MPVRRLFTDATLMVGLCVIQVE